MIGKILAIISFLITILIFGHYFLIYFTLPDYISLLGEVDQELPQVTRFIFSTYKLWIIIPAASLLATLGVITKQNTSRAMYVYFTANILLLLIAIFLLLLAFMGVYAPVAGYAE